MHVKQKHTGRNIRRFRELLGIGQDVLAREMGPDWSPRMIEHLEQQETTEDALLQQVAGILKLPAHVLRNYEEGESVHIIASTFQDESVALAFHCTFNPVDEIIRLYEENIRIHKQLLKEKEEQLAQQAELLKKQA